MSLSGGGVWKGGIRYFVTSIFPLIHRAYLVQIWKQLGGFDFRMDNYCRLVWRTQFFHCTVYNLIPILLAECMVSAALTIKEGDWDEWDQLNQTYFWYCSTVCYVNGKEKQKIKNWGKVKKALPFVCVVCSERQRDERQDPASYSTCQTEWNVVTRQGRKGSFIKVCRITLTRDKRPE